MGLCIVIVCAFATLLNNLFYFIFYRQLYPCLSSLIIIINANNARHFSECFMCTVACYFFIVTLNISYSSCLLLKDEYMFLGSSFV